MRILTVEDDFVVLMDIGDMLEELGHECIAATSAEAALESFGNGDGIDLAMTDLTLPGMTGAELARELRRRSPNMPIIVCSGSDVTDQNVCEASAFLAKPFRSSELQQILENVRARE